MCVAADTIVDVRAYLDPARVQQLIDGAESRSQTESPGATRERPLAAPAAAQRGQLGSYVPGGLTGTLLPS